MNKNSVVNKYYFLLKQAEVISDKDDCLIEPNNEDFKHDNHIVLQQGKENWKDKKVKFVITENIDLFFHFKNKNFKTYLLEFPLEPYTFRKYTLWQKRENKVYFHGRIIPGKLPLEELKILKENNIPVVLQGPICKEYWTDKDIEKKEFIEYKKEIKKLKNITFLQETNDPKEIAKNLNKYKFYFTLSNGEAFNKALEEAIACGTIPLVKSSVAYWWAFPYIFQFHSIEKFLKLYNDFSKIDLEELSTIISNEAQKNFSLEAINYKFKSSFFNFNKNYPPFEYRNFLFKYPEIINYSISESWFEFSDLSRIKKSFEMLTNLSLDWKIENNKLIPKIEASSEEETIKSYHDLCFDLNKLSVT